MSVSVHMSTEVLDKNINAVETAIAFVEKKLVDTYSGVDQLLLNSFIIETREVLAVLEEAKKSDKKITVFNYAVSPEA